MEMQMNANTMETSLRMEEIKKNRLPSLKLTRETTQSFIDRVDSLASDIGVSDSKYDKILEGLVLTAPDDQLKVLIEEHSLIDKRLSDFWNHFKGKSAKETDVEEMIKFLNEKFKKTKRK